MQRVFDDWEEGMSFYRGCFAREGSAYILQQGALYLSNKLRYQEAFLSNDRRIAFAK